MIFIENEKVIQDFDINDTILNISLKNEILHYHECGGKGRCSTCRILIIDGLNCLTPRTEIEQRLAERKGWGDDIRLACQTQINTNSNEHSIRIRKLVIDDEDKYIVLNANNNSSNELSGYEKSLAILFCYIRDLTKFKKDNLPYDVIHAFNRYYNQICQPILANNGSINRYIEDGLIALFGQQEEDPEKICLDAIRSALRMGVRLKIFNRYAKKKFNLEFEMGIGIEYGKVILGSLGHHSKQDYTVLGDTLNIANRLGTLAKKERKPLLIGEQIMGIIGNKLEVGQIFDGKLKGKSRILKFHEVKELKEPDNIFIVQSNIEYLLSSGKIEKVSSMFYKRLFEISPEIKKLFVKTNMELQERMFMNMIISAVESLERTQDLVSILQKIGIRHKEYGVLSEHYPILGEIFIWTLEQIFGDDFTEEVKFAWTEMYASLSKNMIRGAAFVIL